LKFDNAKSTQTVPGGLNEHIGRSSTALAILKKLSKAPIPPRRDFVTLHPSSLRRTYLYTSLLSPAWAGLELWTASSRCGLFTDASYFIHDLELFIEADKKPLAAIKSEWWEDMQFSSPGTSINPDADGIQIKSSPS